QIEAGVRLVEEALLMRRPGSYQVQAANAAGHAETATAAGTDWPQIAVLYDHLLRYEGQPVLALNRAVAVSFRGSPGGGVGRLEGLAKAGALEQYAPFHLARADMFRRLGRSDEAQESYREALSVSQNEQVRRFIEQRLRR